MRIFIVGSSGMLGSECRKVRDHQIFCPEKRELDITNWDMVIERLAAVSPHVILNCAGRTDMEACEKDDDAVRKVNVEGPRNLAQASARFGCKMVHISCGHVFDGQKAVPQPYFEDDPPNPLSGYGRSKLESEAAIRGNSPDYIIVRSMWLYGATGRNMIKALLSRALAKRPDPLLIPQDQIGSPTWSYRLALQIKVLIENRGKGTYHATASGSCSRFEFAAHVLNRLAIKTPIEPCLLKDLKQPVREPVNGLLENRLAKKQGIDVMGDWKEDLDRFLDESGEDLIKEVKKR